MLRNYKIRIVSLKEVVLFIFHFTIYIFFLFEAPLTGALTTRRVSLVIAMFVVAFKTKTVKIIWKGLNQRAFLQAICGLIICMMISAVNYIGLRIENSFDYFKPIYIIYMVLYIVVFAIYSVIVFKDILSFSKIYIPIMILQSFTVFVSVINTDFRMFLYENFYFGDDRFEKTIIWGTRVMGINLHSASGSLIMCTACALLIYISIKKGINNLLFIVSYIIIMAGTLFIGRTGFYVEILLLLIYFVLNRGIAKKVINILGMGVLLVIFASFILARLESYASAHFVTWVGEIFYSATRFDTVNQIQDMEIPKMSLEMVFGTNVMFGVTSSGKQMYSDSGYAKIYCAIGIVGAIIYYFSLFKLYMSILPRTKMNSNKIYLLLLIALAFVLELKEPFFLKYVYTWMVFVIILFELKSVIAVISDKKGM